VGAGVEAGAIQRSDVAELGAVLAAEDPWRREAGEVTLFDSTGLAIQDLGIALAILDAHRSGAIEAPAIEI
jgi:alanine dehydrogenase